jgi:hypothetical protein
VEDSLSLSRLQCFDFQGVNNEQYADLIEPLMVWLLRRINDVLYNPANLGVPKHILIEEIFSSMKNKQLLDGALASIKTVRKNLGGVTMIGQSADDLGANADSIVSSCTSFLFLKDATFNRKRYAELFKMNEQQLALFESLQDREGLYMRRDGLTKVVALNLDSRSYATFSTKPKDRIRRTKLIEKYGLSEASPNLPRARLCNPEGISKECGKGGNPASWLSMLSTLCHFHGLPFARQMLAKPICRHTVLTTKALRSELAEPRLVQSGATALGRGPGQTLPLDFVETSRVLAKVTSEAIPTHPNSRSSPGIDHLAGSGAGRPLRGACSLAGADSSASEGSMLAMTKATDSAAGPEMFSVRFLTDLVSISIPVTCKCAIFLLC